MTGTSPARRRFCEHSFRSVLMVAAGASVVALAAIVIFLVSQAVPLLKETSLTEFLFSTEWYPTEDPPYFGIGALFVGSISVACVTAVIAVPLGILVAGAIHCAMPASVRRIVKPLIELMAAFPSVVIGLVGMTVLAPFLQETFGIATGLNMLNASIMLAFMVIPSIASISEDALKNVPNAIREASLALGATRWETLLRVELRWAMGGIGTAVMLGISRAIGETMVVLMAAGGAAIIPESIFDPVRPMTSSIAAEMAEAAVGSAHYHALYGAGLVLFLVTFAFNLAAWFASKKLQMGGR